MACKINVGNNLERGDRLAEGDLKRKCQLQPQFGGRGSAWGVNTPVDRLKPLTYLPVPVKRWEVVATGARMIRRIDQPSVISELELEALDAMDDQRTEENIQDDEAWLADETTSKVQTRDTKTKASVADLKAMGLEVAELGESTCVTDGATSIVVSGEMTEATIGWIKLHFQESSHMFDVGLALTLALAQTPQIVLNTETDCAWRMQSVREETKHKKKAKRQQDQILEAAESGSSGKREKKAKKELSADDFAALKQKMKDRALEIIDRSKVYGVRGTFVSMLSIRATASEWQAYSNACKYDDDTPVAISIINFMTGKGQIYDVTAAVDKVLHSDAKLKHMIKPALPKLNEQVIDAMVKLQHFAESSNSFKEWALTNKGAHATDGNTSKNVEYIRVVQAWVVVDWKPFLGNYLNMLLHAEQINILKVDSTEYSQVGTMFVCSMTVTIKHGNKVFKVSGKSLTKKESKLSAAKDAWRQIDAFMNVENKGMMKLDIAEIKNEMIIDAFNRLHTERPSNESSLTSAVAELSSLIISISDRLAILEKHVDELRREGFTKIEAPRTPKETRNKESITDLLTSSEAELHKHLMTVEWLSTGELVLDDLPIVPKRYWTEYLKAGAVTIVKGKLKFRYNAQAVSGAESLAMISKDMYKLRLLCGTVLPFQKQTRIEVLQPMLDKLYGPGNYWVRAGVKPVNLASDAAFSDFETEGWEVVASLNGGSDQSVGLDFEPDIAFAYEGDWCGPGWSDGEWQDSVVGFATARSELDQACKDHDCAIARGDSKDEANREFVQSAWSMGYSGMIAALAVNFAGPTDHIPFELTNKGAHSVNGNLDTSPPVKLEADLKTEVLMPIPKKEIIKSDVKKGDEKSGRILASQYNYSSMATSQDEMGSVLKDLIRAILMGKYVYPALPIESVEWNTYSFTLKPLVVTVSEIKVWMPTSFHGALSYWWDLPYWDSVRNAYVYLQKPVNQTFWVEVSKGISKQVWDGGLLMKSVEIVGQDTGAHDLKGVLNFDMYYMTSKLVIEIFNYLGNDTSFHWDSSSILLKALCLLSSGVDVNGFRTTVNNVMATGPFDVRTAVADWFPLTPSHQTVRIPVVYACYTSLRDFMFYMRGALPPQANWPRADMGRWILIPIRESSMLNGNENCWATIGHMPYPWKLSYWTAQRERVFDNTGAYDTTPGGSRTGIRGESIRIDSKPIIRNGGTDFVFIVYIILSAVDTVATALSLNITDDTGAVIPIPPMLANGRVDIAAAIESVMTSVNYSTMRLGGTKLLKYWNETYGDLVGYQIAMRLAANMLFPVQIPGGCTTNGGIVVNVHTSHTTTNQDRQGLQITTGEFTLKNARVTTADWLQPEVQDDIQSNKYPAYLIQSCGDMYGVVAATDLFSVQKIVVDANMVVGQIRLLAEALVLQNDIIASGLDIPLGPAFDHAFFLANAGSVMRENLHKFVAVLNAVCSTSGFVRQGGRNDVDLVQAVPNSWEVSPAWRTPLHNMFPEYVFEKYATDDLWKASDIDVVSYDFGGQSYALIRRTEKNKVTWVQPFMTANISYDWHFTWRTQALQDITGIRPFIQEYLAQDLDDYREQYDVKTKQSTNVPIDWVNPVENEVFPLIYGNDAVDYEMLMTPAGLGPGMLGRVDVLFSYKLSMGRKMYNFTVIPSIKRSTTMNADVGKWI